jgi:hypothetical protein
VWDENGYDAARVEDLISSWRRLRAHFEHQGWVEEDEWIAVLDIERMATALGNYRARNDPAEAPTPDERRRRRAASRDAAQAAEMIACRMLLGWTARDSRFPHRAKLLERKAVAFGVRFLSGATLENADRAFEEAS